MLLVMKKLIVLSDKDIFRDVEEDPNKDNYLLRLAVKIVVFDDDNKIALVGVRYRLLPGGGVEDNESLVEAVKRECLEEIGCAVEIDKEFCYTEEYREKNQRHQITHFFTAKMVGLKGLPQSIQEDEQGLQIGWYSLTDAIKLLEQQVVSISHESYHSCFNVRTHLVALKELSTQM
jgi:8-oxo-dGTP diphosphatase